MPNAEQNKEAIRRATEAWNKRDLEAFVMTYSDPCLYHFGRDDKTLTREAHLASARHYFEVFPDFTATIETLMAENDRVYVRWSYVGTHLGKSRSGIEPTGQRVDFGTVYAEKRFENGLVVEVWELGSFIAFKDIAVPPE